ncbi:GNAT family protein [Bacillus sp. DX4.1]|uniref:GNAT family N-acetyltransferase n=1 Tax=Bacillus sp. DX4.1 TaxID=3055867 RepID=UPI0025A1B70B|nr:GNAT family protein [Bacillus sp. DX4.1]MDM5187874.1 GNAT family protein [Bacillus sp. DX4.1]
MKYNFKIMTQEQAEDIAHNWHYEGEHSFYDIEADQEDLVEFLDPETRGDSTFVVIKNDEMIGFFSFCKVDYYTVDIGLGMRPNLTGNGNGLEFLMAGLAFVQEEYSPENITLSVATFNERAIKVYKKAGFEAVGTFVQETNGSKFEFLKMSYRC